MSTRAPLLIARKVVEIGFGLVIFAVLARSLTQEQFAIYSLLFGYLAIFRLTTLPGLGTAVTQSYARRGAGGFRKAVKLSIAGALLGSLILIGMSAWHSDSNAEDMASALFAAALCFPFFAGLTFWRNAAVGAERYQRLLWLDSTTAAVKCAAVVVSVYLFPQALVPVVLAAMLAPALINLAETWLIVRREPKTSSGEPGGTRYGLRTTLYQVPSVVVQQLDKLVLFYFISPESLAVYAVALRIPELARMVVGEANATLGPLFARQPRYTKELQRFSLKLWLIYIAVSGVGALFVVPVLLPIVAGPAYGDAVPFAQMMAAGVALGYLGDIQFRYVRSHLNARAFLLITTSQAAVDAGLIVGLVYWFGLTGAVVAYVLKALIYTVITSIVTSSGNLKAGGRRFPLAAERDVP